jgi:hypothetical protein
MQVGNDQRRTFLKKQPCRIQRLHEVRQRDVPEIDGPL